MQDIGAKLFDKIHRRKMHSHHNHGIHFLARDMTWLGDSIQSLVDGDYEPRCLKRYYFTDEMVDQLHIPDPIFQHILLRILKPTFKFVMNENCFHLDGPTGVRNATQKIREVLQHSKPKYFIRTDIRSFYKSIPHYKLIQDIKKHWSLMMSLFQRSKPTWINGYDGGKKRQALGIILNSLIDTSILVGIHMPLKSLHVHFNKTMSLNYATVSRLHSSRNKF